MTRKLATMLYVVLLGALAFGGDSTRSIPMGLRNPPASDDCPGCNFVDLVVNIELYGATYNLTVGPYDRYAAETVAQDIVRHGLRFTSGTTTPPANYLYSPNIVRYVHFVTHTTP
jgi:hypothetical protein